LLASGKDFQNTLCPEFSYFLDFKLIQTEKTELCFAMFVQINKMLLNAFFNSATVQQLMQLFEDFALLRLASGQDSIKLCIRQYCIFF